MKWVKESEKSVDANFSIGECSQTHGVALVAESNQTTKEILIPFSS